MQKKLLALAVAGALAPAAAMAQSTVEIYGRANLGLDNWRATGSSVPGGDMKSRNRVFDSGSRVGFRVNEALGGGLRAFVVVETGVNIDSGSESGQSGGANASTGNWASRDSYVGLGGGWGDVRFGRQSIWWSNGVIAQTGANYINSAADGLTTGGFGSVSGPVARQSNVMSHNTPTMGGFNASLSYAPSDQEGATFTGGTQERGAIWGVTGRYTSGALRAQVDWAKRENVSNVADVDNSGFKVGLGWAYAPGSQVSFIHERLENSNITGTNGLVTAGLATAGDDAKVKINLVNWEHMLGQWQLMAQYAWSGKVTGLSVNNSDTRAKAWTLAAKYFLSKRTGVYLSLNQTRNEDNAWADANSGGGYSSGAQAPSNSGLSAGNRGADVRIIAVGIHHNF
jgi:predicted porin